MEGLENLIDKVHSQKLAVYAGWRLTIAIMCVCVCAARARYCYKRVIPFERCSQAND